MTKPIRIVALSGSFRRLSYTTSLLKAFQRLAPTGVEVELIGGLQDLPFFSEDLEAHPPQVVQDFLQKMLTADAFLFGTPEYNRSYPAVLKNAIDWASRSERLIFYQKPAA